MADMGEMCTKTILRVGRERANESDLSYGKWREYPLQQITKSHRKKSASGRREEKQSDMLV